MTVQQEGWLMPPVKAASRTGRGSLPRWYMGRSLRLPQKTGVQWPGRDAVLLNTCDVCHASNSDREKGRPVSLVTRECGCYPSCCPLKHIAVLAQTRLCQGCYQPATE